MSELPDAPELPELDDDLPDPEDAPRNDVPLRILGEDGALHISDLKLIAKSGQQYLHAVNAKRKPNAAMLIGTGIHQFILGPRPGKEVLLYPHGERRGNAWKDFKAENPGREILTIKEWKRAEEIAAEIAADPLVRDRLEGARTEVPLEWEENGIRCATGGVDILGNGALGDLKGTPTAEPKAFERLAFRMYYHCQLAWYRRGARANGLDVSKGLFVIGVERVAPYEATVLDLGEDMIDLADRTLTLWLERIRSYMLSCPEPRRVKDWPGYSQAPVVWNVPEWKKDLDDEDDDEHRAVFEEEEAA